MTLAPLVFCNMCGAGNRAQASFCGSCGRPLQRPTIAISNTLTGMLGQQHLLRRRFLVLEQAGKGGFGAVYKAADTQFGNRLVAVKEMSQNSLDAQELIAATQAFKHEAMLLANLTHPNLPRIYDHFSEGGRWYLVMDFIEGETLESLLQRLGSKLLPVTQVLDIAIQLCSVLDYLHTRQPPIIFRDLKPANVMLTPADHVYLIDFGIARLFKPGQARDTTALGSTGYASPEQYGKSQTTPRADIYSLGATLHQLLSGYDPSNSPFSFANLNFRKQPTLAGLDVLVDRMVRVKIDERPASVASVKRELEHIAMAHKTGSLSYTPGAFQQGKATMQVPAVSRTSTSSKRATKTSLPAIRPTPQTLYVCCGHNSRITSVGWSSDGKLLASTSFDKTLHIWDASNGNNIRICKGHFDRVNSLSWSRDNRYIATASNDGTARIWEVATGNEVFVYTGHSGPVRSAVWSPDGTQLASGGEDRQVHIWDMKNTQASFIFRGHSNPLYTIDWSPDGRRIASGGEDKAIKVWEPVKDQLRRTFFSTLLNRGPVELHGHYGRANHLAWSPDGRSIALGSSNYQLLVWDVASKRIVFNYRTTSTGMKNVVAWSPNGRYLASGCNDKTVQVWSMLDRNTPRFTYYGHTNYVIAVAWSPDGTRIASGGVDHTVQVWRSL